MKRHCFLPLLALLTASAMVHGKPIHAVKANNAPVDIEKGMPFSEARKKLIRAGWKPFDVNAALKRDMQCQGADCELHTMGIKEVELCTMDSAICYFHYRHGRECLRLSTLYERIQDLVINDWSRACAPVSPE